MEIVKNNMTSKELLNSAIEAGKDVVTYDMIEIKKRQIEELNLKKEEISTKSI